MIKEIRIAQMAGQGVVLLKETLGPVVREIEFIGDHWVRIGKFSALDGSIKNTFLNLNNCVWYEFEIDTDAS